jgi:MFS transporter, FSR family, fosmidomycin resistance protein
LDSAETSDDLLSKLARRSEWRRLGVLSFGHFVSDLYQGAIPALLPYLVLAHDLSLANASLMVLAFTVTASVTQPGFGWLADKREISWLAPLGLVVCGGAFALIMLTSDLLLHIILACICGGGNAAFHPQAARDVTRLLDHRPSFAISIFMVGGQGGFAIGPLVIAIVLNSFGRGGAALLLLPALIAAGMVFQWHASALKGATSTDGVPAPEPAGSNDWTAFSILMGIVLIWSVVSVGTYSYLGLYWTLELGQSAASANFALTAMLIAGVMGMVGGSWLADRSGAVTVVGTGFALSVAALVLVMIAASPGPALIAAIVLGICVYSPFAVIVVLGQRFLPGSTGMASGVTMGLSMSIGGLAAPGLGAVADTAGFPVLFALLAIGASVACGLSIWLACTTRGSASHRLVTANSSASNDRR